MPGYPKVNNGTLLELIRSLLRPIERRLAELERPTGTQRVMAVQTQAEHTAELADHETRITNNESVNNDQGTRLNAVESKNSQQDTRLTTDEGTLNSHTTSINGLTTRMTNAETINNDQGTRLNTAESTNNTQDTRLGGLESRMSNAETINNSQGTRLNTAESNINAHEARLDADDTELNDLQSDVSVTQNQIATLQMQMDNTLASGLQTRIKNLEARVYDLEHPNPA